jgi:small conductance mechanosensitive channel
MFGVCIIFLIFDKFFKKTYTFMDKILDGKSLDIILLYAPKALFAIVIFVVGLWLIGRFTQAADKGMTKSGIDPDLRPFLGSMLNFSLKIFLVLSVANIVGIETTSVVAIMASAFFAVGLALQGTLSNFAAGVMILIFKPYRVGDIVEMQRIHGKVKEIQIFNTLVVTQQEKIIIVPNGTAINGIISNLTTQQLVKTNVLIPVRYNQDFEEIKLHILVILRGSDLVLAAPHVEVEVESFGVDGLIVGVYAPCKAENLETLTSWLNERIYKELTKSGIKLGAKVYRLK